MATIYFGWGVFSFGLRSQLLGFFFFNLTLYLLTRIEEKPKLAFLLPLITFLWANTHGSVILGLILVSVAYFLSVVRNARFSSGARGSYFMATATKRVDAAQSGVVVLSSILVTLINPFGFRIYEEAWRHFSGPIDLSKLIAEWAPPQPHIQQLIFTSGTVALLFVLFKSFRNSEIPFALFAFLISTFAFLALKARRNVPLYFVVLSYSLLNSLKTKISPLRNQLAGLLSVGVLLYGLTVQLPQAIEYNDCQRDVPCQAVEFLEAQEVKGNIFNRYEWGGFLIWRLPEYKIFVDGRMPSWLVPRSFSEGGPASGAVSPYTIYLHTLQTRPGWQETLDEHNIAYILISPNTFMDLKLRKDPTSLGWQEVYRDKISVIYKKTLSWCPQGHVRKARPCKPHNDARLPNRIVSRSSNKSVNQKVATTTRKQP